MGRPFSSLVFIFSLVIAYGLYFYPLRGEMTYWRPMFVFVVVIFWLRVEPHVLGVGFAWLAGLALDLLSGGTLGQNALAMAIVAYLLQLAGQRMSNFSVWHQMLVVTGLALFYQMVTIVVSLIAGKAADNWFMLYPVLSTVLLWPFVTIALWKLYKIE
ncbi:MAG: rod shape-determining protein MreD [Porticoccaceae bacterium]|nr:rod shape-determining protein MreD [Porticoccaceae bacterium]